MKRLKYYMALYELSLEQLAKKIGVTKSAVSLWTTGKNVPRMDKVDLLCEVFHCSRVDLLTELPGTNSATIIELMQLMPDDMQKRLISYARFLLKEGEDKA